MRNPVELAVARTLANQAGTPATLTREEWAATQAHFNGRCAYCDTNEAVGIEHATSISLGGGTTRLFCMNDGAYSKARKVDTRRERRIANAARKEP